MTFASFDKFPFREAVSKVPFQNLSLLSVGCIDPECSVNSVVYIYDVKGFDKPTHGICEAVIEAENHYQGAPTVCSRKETPKRAAKTSPDKNSSNAASLIQ